MVDNIFCTGDKGEKRSLMKNILFLISSLLFSACTLTISQTATDTHGYANDVVDETQKTETDADLTGNLSIPAL